MASGTIMRKYGCCNLQQANIPQSPKNLAIFYVRGYYYRSVPDWFDVEGAPLIPLQFTASGSALEYKFMFYKPDTDLCNMVWYMSTSDNIMPQIYEWITQKEMNVKRGYVYNGYTTWIISC